MAALTGIRVLDFSHFIAGPYCSQTLADHGAEVIKVEPLDGEMSRKSGPFYEGSSIYFETMNRNKKSISIDLKAPGSKKIIEELVKSADVLVTNYAVGVPERLGIGYPQVSAMNPRLIMVHISGFGQTGPLKNTSAFDGVIQAMSGVAHLTGALDGPPLKAGVFVADYVAAFNGVIGALLGLQSREKTGKGQFVDVGMLDTMASMLLTTLSEASLLNDSPARGGSRSKNVFATTFPTLDGHFYLAALTEKMWTDFCELTGIDELNAEGNAFSTGQDRLDRYDELEGIITKWSLGLTTKEILSALNDKRIACGQVNTLDDVLENEQLKARDMLLKMDMNGAEIVSPGVPVKLSDEEYQARRAPRLGGDTLAILKEAGIPESEIEELAAAGVIQLG